MNHNNDKHFVHTIKKIKWFSGLDQFYLVQTSLLQFSFTKVSRFEPNVTAQLPVIN